MQDLTICRCPVTRQRLVQIDPGHLQTADGSRSYGVVHGIPDFRLFDPPYISREEEFAICGKLVEKSRDHTYAEVLQYLELDLAGDRPDAAKRKSLQHRMALRERAPSRLRELLDRAGRADVPKGGRILDLGCGSGEATVALSGMGAGEVVGIDISMVELVLAKKLFEECGIEATLVAGCAEALPFEESVFDFVFSPDVIEHVTDQGSYLKEARRVLRAGGQVLLNSPNRYSVVCPEPHVGIWFLTYLPRSWLDPVCRMLGKGPYVGKRLLSLNELESIVRSTFSEHFIVGRVSNPHATSLAGKLFHAASPLSVNAFAQVCDQHVVLARK